MSGCSRGRDCDCWKADDEIEIRGGRFPSMIQGVVPEGAEEAKEELLRSPDWDWVHIGRWFAYREVDEEAEEEVIHVLEVARHYQWYDGEWVDP